MRIVYLIQAALIAVMLSCGCSDGDKNEYAAQPPNDKILTFYYPWYGNPETDGGYRHWNHPVLDPKNEGQSFPGGDDIGANFYPELGCYSSHDSKIMEKHASWMRRAGIGLVCVSWWGRDSYEDKTIPALMEAAEKYGLKITFHIEPFEGRDIKAVGDAIGYIIDTYGNHPAFFRDERHGSKPIFFIYDSYQIDAAQWATLLDINAIGTIRGTRYNASIIALWVNPHEEEFILSGQFDGFYTYFAADGFTYGSTAANWPQLTAWAEANDKIFIPCIGPGYLDTRIRLWNTANIQSRAHGAYYDRMFSSAIKADPSFIGITSFNEWHEGTQIEPAIPKSSGEYLYNDYSPLPSDYYLNRTRYWVDRYEQRDSPDSTPESDKPVNTHRAFHTPVMLTSKYDPKYDAGGEMGLIDGLRGTTGYRDGRWQGFEQVDFEATVDLEAAIPATKISIGFLQAVDAWIFLPESVELAVSEDGRNFKVIATQEGDTSATTGTPFIKEFEFKFDPVEARYIRVRANNIGTCPDWHPGAGGKAWLFVDEIVVD